MLFFIDVCIGSAVLSFFLSYLVNSLAHGKAEIFVSVMM